MSAGFVPAGDPVLDVACQVGHAAVRAALQPLCGQFGEPTLDQLHPRAVGGGEANAEAGMTLEPALDLRGAVGGEVVQGDMHGKLVGHLFVY